MEERGERKVRKAQAAELGNQKSIDYAWLLIERVLKRQRVRNPIGTG